MSEFKPHEYADTCRVCGWKGLFVRSHRAIRETYACRSCKATMRYRVQADALLACYREAAADTLKVLAADPAFRALAIYEPGIAGPFRPLLGDLPNYRKSFYWDGLKSGEIRDGIECQDLMAMSHRNDTFDLVISSDVLEHVRRPFAAFREIHRVLKPKGMHVFTIPTVHPLPDRTTKRVDVDGPEDIHLMEPLYHGDGKGGRSLVYNDFGRDLLAELFNFWVITSIHAYPVNEPNVRTAIAFVSVKADSWLLGGTTGASGQ